MLTTLEWLMAILRVKTICWERFERKGIDVSQYEAVDQMNFSEDCNYLRRYKLQASKLGQPLLDEVYARFKTDSNINRVKKRNKR